MTEPRGSNWADATREPLACPRCLAINLALGAKPTIEREQDGSYSCSQCGHSWRVSPTDKDKNS